MEKPSNPPIHKRISYLNQMRFNIAVSCQISGRFCKMSPSGLSNLLKPYRITSLKLPSKIVFRDFIMFIILYQVWTACEKHSHVGAKATDQDVTPESWFDNHTNTTVGTVCNVHVHVSPMLCSHDRTDVRCLKLMIKDYIKFPWWCLLNCQVFAVMLQRNASNVFCVFYFPLSRTHAHTHTLPRKGRAIVKDKNVSIASPLSLSLWWTAQIFGLLLIQSSLNQKHLQAIFLPS